MSKLKILNIILVIALLICYLHELFSFQIQHNMMSGISSILLLIMLLEAGRDIKKD